MSDDTVINIDPNNLDIEQFALGDLLTVQEQIGVDITDKGSFGSVSTLQQLQAIVFLLQRRTDPEFTWEDTRRISLGSLKIAAKNGQEAPVEVDPT